MLDRETGCVSLNAIVRPLKRERFGVTGTGAHGPVPPVARASGLLAPSIPTHELAAACGAGFNFRLCQGSDATSATVGRVADRKCVRSRAASSATRVSRADRLARNARHRSMLHRDCSARLRARWRNFPPMGRSALTPSLRSRCSSSTACATVLSVFRDTLLFAAAKSLTASNGESPWRKVATGSRAIAERSGAWRAGDVPAPSLSKAHRPRSIERRCQSNSPLTAALPLPKMIA